MTEPVISGGAAVTEDMLLGGRVRLRQPAAGYRVAVDPVLLAAAVPAQAGERVLDIGCGSGAAALCLAARVPGVTVLGLERYAPAAAMAGDNVVLNGMGDRVRVVEGCLLAPPPDVVAGGFQRVMMNPPYLAAGAATPPPDPWKAAANVEGAAVLADWVTFAHRCLMPGGTVTLIHRADRIDEILAALCPLFDGMVVFPLWPDRTAPAARRMLVSAVRRRNLKGGRRPARLAQGLILHDAGHRVGDGEKQPYTDGARMILENASALIL